MTRQAYAALIAGGLLTMSGSAASGRDAVIHYWSFDCDDTDLITLTPPVFFGDPTPVPAKSGMGYEFDGEDDYINTTITPQLGPEDSMSFAVWVRMPSAPPAQPMEIMGLERAGFHQEIRLTIRGGTGTVTTDWRDDNYSAGPVETSTSLCDGRWHHFASVCDRDNGLNVLYVDGLFVGSHGTPPGPINETEPIELRLGADWDSDDGSVQFFFQGIIDEVRFFDYALSEEDVLGLIAKQYLIAAEDPCPGDADHDGNVGVTDFLIMLANWGPCPGE
jgi:hypothetical protein